MRRAIVLATFALAVVSCDTMPTEPGVREFTPEPTLLAALVPIWVAVEACSGQTRPMAEVRWFEIPGALTFHHDGETVYGYYRAPNQIVMGEEGYYLDAWVAHEMLHAIEQTPGHGPAFTGACARVVAASEDHNTKRGEIVSLHGTPGARRD